MSFVIKTKVFKGLFYFQRFFFKYIYYTTMMFFVFKKEKANVSVDTGIFHWALWGKYRTLDARGQYARFLATVFLQEGASASKLGATTNGKSTSPMYSNWWGKKKLPVLAYWDLKSKRYTMQCAVVQSEWTRTQSPLRQLYPVNSTAFLRADEPFCACQTAEWREARSVERKRHLPGVFRKPEYAARPVLLVCHP